MDVTSGPLLSVLMCVYNGERHVEAAIESVLNQTYTDFEFIILDDGSTDTTPDILARFAASDDRIRLLKNETNKGVPASSTIGFRAASGTYVARMDADDVMHEMRFEKQMAFLAKHPEVGLLGTDTFTTDQDLKLFGTVKYPRSSGMLKWLLYFYMTLHHPTCVMRAEVVQKVGYYREKFRIGSDFDLFNRMRFHTEFAMVPEPLYYYRHWGGNISMQSTLALEKSFVMSLTEAISTLLGRSISEEQAAAFRNLGRRLTGFGFPETPEAVQDAVALAIEVFEKFGAQQPLSRKERWEIRHHLALIHVQRSEYILPQSPKLARSLAWKAIQYSPFIVVTVLGKMSRRLVRRLTKTGDKLPD